jgi:hypothetical protein
MFSPETRFECIAHVDPRLMFARAMLQLSTQRRDATSRSFPPTIVNWFVSQVPIAQSLHRDSCLRDSCLDNKLGNLILSLIECFLVVIIRSSGSVSTCSSAALQLSPSNSHRPSPPLPPHSPHSRLFCHASTPLRPPTTPTSIASAATGCFTVGSSAGSLITCRAWWDCRWLHRARLLARF